jgi:hypothetical protein
MSESERAIVEEMVNSVRALHVRIEEVLALDEGLEGELVDELDSLVEKRGTTIHQLQSLINTSEQRDEVLLVVAQLLEPLQERNCFYLEELKKKISDAGVKLKLAMKKKSVLTYRSEYHG